MDRYMHMCVCVCVFWVNSYLRSTHTLTHTSATRDKSTTSHSILLLVPMSCAHIHADIRPAAGRDAGDIVTDVCPTTLWYTQEEESSGWMFTTWRLFVIHLKHPPCAWKRLYVRVCVCVCVCACACVYVCVYAKIHVREEKNQETV